ncbi:MAG: hypothetical protein K6A65_02480 [Succinivibrionaceae bacterium]|nr:hypothetical protein [Succinivibrionaceae bacterium]
MPENPTPSQEGISELRGDSVSAHAQKLATFSASGEGGKIVLDAKEEIKLTAPVISLEGGQEVSLAVGNNIVSVTKGSVTIESAYFGHAGTGSFNAVLSLSPYRGFYMVAPQALIKTKFGANICDSVGGSIQLTRGAIGISGLPVAVSGLNKGDLKLSAVVTAAQEIIDTAQAIALPSDDPEYTEKIDTGLGIACDSIETLFPQFASIINSHKLSLSPSVDDDAVMCFVSVVDFLLDLYDLAIEIVEAAEPDWFDETCGSTSMTHGQWMYMASNMTKHLETKAIVCTLLAGAGTVADPVLDITLGGTLNIMGRTINSVSAASNSGNSPVAGIP